MFRTRDLSFVSVFVLALTFASGAAQALPYSSLVIFGDSLVDAGNNAEFFDTEIAPPGTPPGTLRTPTPIGSPTLDPIEPYASNRYSNGPVWVEQFAASLRLSAEASLLGGSNFAFGGARTGPAGPSFPFSLTDQVAMFLGGPGGVAQGDALYVVAGGGNNAGDAFALAAGGGDPGAIIEAIEAYVTDIAIILTRLSGAGAQDILLVNVPNIGVAPAIQAFGPVAAAGASAIAAEMNTALDGVLAGLLPSLIADVKVFDFYSTVTQTVADPSAFGLTDVTSACAFSAACIANPDTTLFWDGTHPTTAGHALIARAALAVAIPEPSSLALMLIVGLVFVTHRVTRRAYS